MPDTLSPPGSSTYASDTMYVGDGTWDSTRNTFLLPNVMGLNFDTMRYNGMGNRFREMDGYYTLILAHGIIATIVFLGFVPAAIMIVRYYSIYDRYWAYKYHVWLQVLTLLLSTVVFLLGWFAVGPRRSLTNPHHGIGLAIYVLVIFQALWGWLSRKIERGRRHYRSPLILVMHRWIGWATLLLGFAQIPLGLTLYGSPKSLFILFTVGAFLWLALFLICSYVYDEDGVYYGPDTDSRGSYVSGPPPEEERRTSGLGGMAGAAAAGAGLAALFSRRSHNREESDVHSSQYEEKYSDEGHHSKWGRRLLEIGAIGGGIALARSIFNRRRDRESDRESGRYRPTHARSDRMTEDTISRVEEGQAAAAETQGPYMHPAKRQSYSSIDYSYYTQTDDGADRPAKGGEGHGLRNAILGAGAFAAMRNLFRRRKNDDEQERVEEIKRRDMEEERLARANSKKKYTGDGFFPRRQRPSQSALSSEMTSDLTPRPSRRPERDESTVMTGGITDNPESELPENLPSRRVTSGSATGTDIESAAAVGAVAGGAAGSASRHRRRSGSASGSRRSDRRHEVSSPPVSVKVRMHNDGRHVTLRKLTEEEAAASRDSKRRSRERRGSRRRGSASSLSGGEGPSSDRWRRVEEMERRQAEHVQREQAAALAAESGAAAAATTMPNPPPPPVPFHSGSIHPPTASYAATSQQSATPHPPPPIAPGISGSIHPPTTSYVATSQHSAPLQAPDMRPSPPQHLSPMPHGTTSQLSTPQRPPSNMQQYNPTASQQYPPTASITSPTWTGTEASADYANNRRRRRAERAQARARQQAQHSVEFT